MKKFFASFLAALWLLTQVAQAQFIINELQGFNVGDAALGFSYRNTYVDTVDATSFTVVAADFGTPASNRLVIAGLNCDNRQITGTPTLGGVGATLAIGAATTSGIDIWYAVVPTGETGNIDATCTASAVSFVAHVWVGYPASATPVDALLQEGAGTTTRVLTDLQKTSGGFAVFTTITVAANHTSSMAQTGAETIIENYDARPDAVASFSAYSFDVTATTTTDDFTATWSASGSHALIGATWGP